MMSRPGAIYLGDVVHKRVRPVEHKLSYRVFSLLLDCQNLQAESHGLRFFSHNRFNLISIHDRDHGDGGDLSSYLRGLAEQAGHGELISRFVMLCYPRILGYAFNPLTVYYGLDKDSETRLVIYEVNNTFGERKTYVIPAMPDDQGVVWQQCPKQFFVSPFNKVSGTYSFHLTRADEELTLGVALKDQGRAVMRAQFRGKRAPLTDRNLLGALSKTGLMTLKVIVGIHIHAALLWFKGLRLQNKPARPDPAISIFSRPRLGAEDVPVSISTRRGRAGADKPVLKAKKHAA